MNDNFEILLVVAFIVLVGWGVTHLMTVKETVMREPEQPKEPEVPEQPKEPEVPEQPKEPEVVETPAKPKRGRKKAVPAPDAPVKTKRTPKKKVTE